MQTQLTVFRPYDDIQSVIPNAPLKHTTLHFPTTILATDKKDKSWRACHLWRQTSVGEQRHRDTMCRDCKVAQLKSSEEACVLLLSCT
ncbi:hypothetical protein J6590_062508 [Homalodisca vitripennis]|nr:hypothetical protein J6590_062508 [Homalodisca vitripennis]